MKALPRNRPVVWPSKDEIESFEQALDKTYSRLRERAQAAWKRDHPGNDPADGCVNVRVTPSLKTPAELRSRQKRVPRALVAKPRKRRSNIALRKARRQA